jgi:hypothetical protein
VITFGLGRRGQGLEELLYHLVIYKHLRTFYLDAGRVAEAASDRLAA